MATEINGGSFKITLGFAVQVIVTVLSIGIAWASVKSDLGSSMAQSADNAATIRILQSDLVSSRLEVRELSTKIDILMKNYERDANKYIRDPNDRR